MSKTTQPRKVAQLIVGYNELRSRRPGELAVYYVSYISAEIEAPVQPRGQEIGGDARKARLARNGEAHELVVRDTAVVVDHQQSPVF